MLLADADYVSRVTCPYVIVAGNKPQVWNAVTCTGTKYKSSDIRH